ncbi:MAG: hypothetical protein CSB21_01795 [Deltaproteobacteria bacterium]|nr:MAG: hypothetical protein CSB21_01795 [Deltaproteobacteria bacterium]
MPEKDYEDPDNFYRDAFSRNTGLLSKDEQLMLRNAKVAIPGMGGVGGLHVMTLARTGIGNFNLADYDEFEIVNINRQYGANINTFGRKKIDVMAENALSVNPFAKVTRFENGIDETNIDDFLDGVDVVIDALDFFKFDIRRLLFKRAAEKGIYVVTAGPMGFSSAMLVFSPDGMGFDEYFNIVENMSDEERYLSFAIGLSPRPTHIKYMNMKNVDLESKAGPSLNIACQICAGMAAAEAVKIITKRGKVLSAPCFSQFDPYLNKYCRGRLFMGNKNPVQKLKKSIVKFMIERNKPVISSEIPELPDFKTENEIIDKSVIEYLVKAGVRAPSGDNCQPWKFAFSENRLDIYLDKEKDDSFFNINQMASVISCGAAAENICIAASVFGLSTEVIYHDETDNNPLVSIKLSPGQVKKDFLADEIFQRNTNRKIYDKKPVSDLLAKELKAQVHMIEGVDIELVRDRKKIEETAELVYEADIIRSEHRPLHKHLMKMIRFSDKEAFKKKDGFHIKNLEAGFAGELFLRVTRPWFIMNAGNKAGLSKVVAHNSYKGIIGSSGVGLIYVKDRAIQNFVRGGQALERFWLKTSEYGLSMQPMTAITLFMLRYKMNGVSDFIPEHRERVKNLYNKMSGIFNEINMEDAGQIMLFRFGYSNNIKYRTLRKNFEI